MFFKIKKDNMKIYIYFAFVNDNQNSLCRSSNKYCTQMNTISLSSYKEEYAWVFLVSFFAHTHHDTVKTYDHSQNETRRDRTCFFFKYIASCQDTNEK